MGLERSRSRLWFDFVDDGRPAAIALVYLPRIVSPIWQLGKSGSCPKRLENWKRSQCTMRPKFVDDQLCSREIPRIYCKCVLFHYVNNIFCSLIRNHVIDQPVTKETCSSKQLFS